MAATMDAVERCAQGRDLRRLLDLVLMGEVDGEADQ